MKEILRSIVLKNDTPAGRAFDLAMQALILASMVTFAVETLPNLDPRLASVLRVVEVGTVIAFTIEYGLRLSLSLSPWRFATSFYGLIDLAAILPFYLATGLDLRSLRAVRLMRLFRIGKLPRYGHAMDRFAAAFKLIRSELVLFFSASGIVIYLAAVGIYLFEHDHQPEQFASVFDGLWWAVASLTTVGYGDVYPVTVGGKAFTMVVLIIGLGIVAVPAGLIASALSTTRLKEALEPPTPESPRGSDLDQSTRPSVLPGAASEL